MNVWAQVGLVVGTALLGTVLGYWLHARQTGKQSFSERASLVQALLLEIMRNHQALAPTQGLKAPAGHMEDTVWSSGKMKLGEFLPTDLMVKLEFVYANLDRVREAFQLAIQVRSLAAMQRRREQLSGVFDKELEATASDILGEEMGEEFKADLDELDDFERTMLDEARKGALAERREIEGFRQKAVEALKWAVGWEAQLKECFDELRQLDQAKAMRKWADTLEPTVSQAAEDAVRTNQ